jgi:hypothetical protein
MLSINNDLVKRSTDDGLAVEVHGRVQLLLGVSLVAAIAISFAKTKKVLI